MRGALLLAALLLVATPAAAQFVSRAPMGVSHPEMIFEKAVVIELRTDDPTLQSPPQVFPWLVAGYDNVVNLTVRNQQDVRLNATFRLNVTGATVSVDELAISVAPYGYAGVAFVVHPTDVGVVKIGVEATDAFQPGGEPLDTSAEFPALALPSITFIDPPVPGPPAEGEEFTRIDSFGGGAPGVNAYIRIPPGTTLNPRIELRNPFDTSLAGFKLRVMATSTTLPDIDVQALEAGATRVIELPEYRPVDASQGQFYGGMMGRYEVRPIAEVSVGGATLSANAMAYSIERGAVVDPEPASLTIDVQDGLVIDLFVPAKPVLGVPTRIKYNFTNLQTTTATGRITITLTPPNGLFYEVQGPESHELPVALAGGERRSGSVDFTPRVSGSWVANSFFRSDQNFGTGSGGGFDVPGPVTIAFDRSDQVFARIGEAIDVAVTLSTTQPIQDARLRIASGGQFYRGEETASGGDFRPGFAQDLIRATTATSSLGTLRPGGNVNASIELVARSSGYYNIVPYVLAEGFAYTSTLQRDPETSAPITPDFAFSQTMLNVQVMPRNVPAGLSLAPLTLGLAFFVGAWTLRTRFVR